MKILILSCDTGEGHNSAGRAVKEAAELKGHTVEMMDADGAFVTTEGFGNNHIDFASHHEIGRAHV